MLHARFRVLDMARFRSGNALRQDRQQHEDESGDGESFDLRHADHPAGALKGGRASKYLHEGVPGEIGVPFLPVIALYLAQMNLFFSGT
jgi:hypothetical protein